MKNSVKRLISLVLGIGALAMLAVALYMDFAKTGNAIRGPLLVVGLVVLIVALFMFPTRKHRAIVNFVFLFPLVFTFLVTVILPFFCGLFYSMTDWNGVKYKEFVGMANYVKMFTSADYTYSFVITLLFTIFNMILINGIGFALALLCTSKVKGKNFYRAAYFLPNLIGGLVLGYVWQFVFNKVFVAIFEKNSMLADANLAFVAMLIVSSWQCAGYIMMIYVTGLQTLPRDVIEASSIDGANFWTTLFRIKIPMIWNTFTVCLFLTLVNSFKGFDVNFALTNGAPSRILNDNMYQATEFLALSIYNTAITKNKYALGQAKAVVFFILLAIVSLTQVWISKKKEVEL